MVLSDKDLEIIASVQRTMPVKYVLCPYDKDEGLIAGLGSDDAEFINSVLHRSLGWFVIIKKDTHVLERSIHEHGICMN